MEQSPSCEACSHSAAEEICPTFIETESSLPALQSRPESVPRPHILYLGDPC